MWQRISLIMNVITAVCHIFLRELFYAMSEPPLRADAKGASPLARTFNFQFLIVPSLLIQRLHGILLRSTP